MTSAARLAVRALPIALAVLFAFAHPAPAAAATPCWKQLLNDWYDGRIDKTYPLPCYQQTLKHLPKDVEVYSSARDDIQRALAQAVQRKNHPKTSTSTTSSTPAKTTVSPNPQPKPPTGGGTTTKTVTSTVPATTTTTSPPVQGRQNDNGPFGTAIDKINPGSAESLPLPLLVLGGLALLLVGAGVAGLILRRVQQRRYGV